MRRGGVDVPDALDLTYEKIVTHNDFDGVVSASLCLWGLRADRVFFTGPLAITRNQITITERDVVCDLPYPLQCGLWFDHHEGNRQEVEYRKIDPQAIPGRFDLKPSCSRVVYEFFAERKEVPSFFFGAVEEADAIDSFSFPSIREWRKETPGKVIDWTLKARFASNEEQNAYMRNLVQQLRTRAIEDVSCLPFVQKQFKLYQEEESRMMRTIEQASRFLDRDVNKEVVMIDLTAHRWRPHLIKNLAFLLYPEALAVCEVYSLVEQGVKSNSLGFSMSLSIEGNLKAKSKNIGEIMRTLNIGDGHPGAAAGTLRCATKQEMLKKKDDTLNRIFTLWSSQ
jgi:hypothetical protein